MQKRSHKQLASALLRHSDGFSARRYELAFLFGSFQPDCNPLTYLRGSLRSAMLRGHHYSNSRSYIHARIQKLAARQRPWTLRQYYALGKLSHYLADAFTYPHNSHYPDTLAAHHRYEHDLRLYMKAHLSRFTLGKRDGKADFISALDCLHRAYMSRPSHPERDLCYIWKAGLLLMALCPPISS